MMKEKHLKETGLADLAYKAESDHEVQMARGDLYKIAKYAIKLHEMLKGVEEREGLDGWVQSKITKAADYIGSVYHHLDYELKFDEVVESKKMPMGAGPDGKKGTDDDKPAFLNQKTGGKKSKGGSKPKKGVVPPQFKKNVKEADDKKSKETMKVSKADEDANTVAYQRWRAGDERYEYPGKTQPRKSHEESYVDTLAHRLKSKLDEAKDVCSECGKPSYTTLGLSEAELDEVAGPEKCWKGYKRAGTQKGTGKNAGKRVNKCVKA